MCPTENARPRIESRAFSRRCPVESDARRAAAPIWHGRDEGPVRRQNGEPIQATAFGVPSRYAASCVAKKKARRTSSFCTASGDGDGCEEAGRYLAVADSLRKIDDGLREYETKTRLFPDDPATWATYGYALYQVGRDADAMQAFQAALHIGPENVEVRFGVANLFLKHREIERALDEYDVILREDETFVPAWINAGIALARIGQRDAARSAWEAALRHDPENELAREYLNGLPPPD